MYNATSYERGPCEHRHATVSSAVRCAITDQAPDGSGLDRITKRSDGRLMTEDETRLDSHYYWTVYKGKALCLMSESCPLCSEGATT